MHVTTNLRNQHSVNGVVEQRRRTIQLLNYVVNLLYLPKFQLIFLKVY